MGLFSKKVELPFKGALFNLNGTVIDNERWLTQAWWNILARRGLRFQDYTDEWHAGRAGDEYFRGMMEFFGIEESLEAFAKEWQREADALVLEHAELAPGVSKLLKEMRKNSIRLAVVTASTKKMTERLLLKFGIFQHFQILFTQEWLNHIRCAGKPDFASYLTAAHGLDLHPAGCIAFENTVNGVTSAKLAEIRTVIGIVNYPTEGSVQIQRKHNLLHSAGVNFTLNSLKGFTLKEYAYSL